MDVLASFSVIEVLSELQFTRNGIERTQSELGRAHERRRAAGPSQKGPCPQASAAARASLSRPEPVLHFSRGHEVNYAEGAEPYTPVSSLSLDTR